MNELRLPNNWTPRPYQMNLWRYLTGGGKRAVVNWPRRHGKDDVGLHFMAMKAHQRKGNLWYMLPEAAQARKSVWDAINPRTGMKRLEESFPLELRQSSHEQEMKIVLKCGSIVQLVGSDNFLSLIGSPPVGLVFSEWKVANPQAWGYLRPILLENGGWAYFNSTPQGKNHFYTLCNLAAVEPEWFYEKLTNDDTQLFSKDEMARELREMQAEHGEDYGRALFLQEYYTSFEAAIPGSIWGDAIERARSEGRIADFSHDRSVPVNTGFDLGRTDDTSIWFSQPNGAYLDVIDQYASAFLDIYNPENPEKSIVHILLERRKELGITYGTHWLPHDARPRTLAAGGKSILQQLHDAAEKHPELGRFAIGKRLDRQEGIAAGRATLRISRFHATRCFKGLEHLKQYHRVYDQDKKMFADIPYHGPESHDADAWRTLALSWRYPKAKEGAPLALTDRLARTVSNQTFGSMKESHFAKQRALREQTLH